MYSVVLLAALTAGAQAPDCHHCGAASYGTCYGSCYGNYGIDAGYGGYGSCYGSCTGAYFANPGACWGGACYGGCYGAYGYPDYSSSGCYGCTGSYGAASPYFVTPPGGVVPSTPATTPEKKGETLPEPAKKPGTESLAPSRAKLIVEVPAGAKLYIDDHAMKTPSEHRVYQTPTLEPGQTYYYEVRVETNHDGKALSQTKRVLLRAGQEVRADFKDIDTTTTAKAE